MAEVPFAETRALRAEWYADHDEDRRAWRPSPPPRRRSWRGAALRAFVVRDGAARRSASPRWPPGDGAVEIDQLYVSPEHRGGGLGGARCVDTALAAGGEPLAWIVADDEGRARTLYERAGFATVWRQHAFIRVPPG